MSNRLVKNYHELKISNEKSRFVIISYFGKLQHLYIKILIKKHYNQEKITIIYCFLMDFIVPILLIYPAVTKPTYVVRILLAVTLAHWARIKQLLDKIINELS